MTALEKVFGATFLIAQTGFIDSNMPIIFKQQFNEMNPLNLTYLLTYSDIDAANSTNSAVRPRLNAF